MQQRLLRRFEVLRLPEALAMLCVGNLLAPGHAYVFVSLAKSVTVYLCHILIPPLRAGLSRTSAVNSALKTTFSCAA